jgi:hypothetical protein
MAVTVGPSKNTMHVYSLIDYQLKYCFCPESDNLNSNIIDLQISKKNKFISLLYSDWNLEIFNLSEEKIFLSSSKCSCVEYYSSSDFDIKEGKEKISFKERTKGFFLNTFTKLKKIIYDKNSKSFCKYKFDREDPLISYNNSNSNKISFLNNKEEIYFKKYAIVNFDKNNELVSFI